MKVLFQKLKDTAILPRRATLGSAGCDLHACLDEAITVEPGQTALVPTGFAMALPEGFGGFVFARSGLGIKHGIAPANCVGVVDSDYRGEIMVGLHNAGDTDYTIQPADRIAQLMIAPVVQATVTMVDELDDTARGAGGFGSTGK